MKNYFKGLFLPFFLVLLITGFHGYWLQAALSLLLFVILLTTLLPVSVILFGKSLDAFIFGFPVAYLLHSVVLSIVGRFAGTEPPVLIVYLIAAACLFVWLRSRFTAPDSTPWSEAEKRLLLVWLCITVFAVCLPLLQVGAATEHAYAYRAYFNYDFFKHLSVTGAIANTGIPAENPYFSGETLHYYWFFYTIPAFFSRIFPAYPPQFLMLQFVLFGALSFSAALFVVLRGMRISVKVMMLVLLLLVMGGTYEGWLGLFRLHERGQDWRLFVTLNIDGLTRWYWQTPQIDTLYRALLYAPQHLLALAIVLMKLRLDNRELSLAAHAIVAFLVFTTLGFAALIGAVFIIAFLVFEMIALLRQPRRQLPFLAVTVVTGLFFLLLYFPLLEMFQLQSGDLQFGLIEKVWERFASFFLLNGGAIWIIGLAGLIRHTRPIPLKLLLFFLTFSILSMHFVRDQVGGQEISLKLGYLCNLSFLILSAAFLQWLAARFRRGYAIAAILCVILVLPASISWLMDLYNTSDIRNTRFTTFVPKEDQEVFAWIRKNVPPDTVLQNYSIEGENARFSLIPALAFRPVFLGDRFHAQAFQISEPDFEKRKAVIRNLFYAKSPEEAGRIAGQAGIKYIFFSSKDTFSAAMRPTFSPPHFSTIFQNGNALLLRVNEP